MYRVVRLYSFLTSCLQNSSNKRQALREFARMRTLKVCFADIVPSLIQLHHDIRDLNILSIGIICCNLKNDVLLVTRDWLLGYGFDKVAQPKHM